MLITVEYLKELVNYSLNDSVSYNAIAGASQQRKGKGGQPECVGWGAGVDRIPTQQWLTNRKQSTKG